MTGISPVLRDLQKWWLSMPDEQARQVFADFRQANDDFYLRGALAACSQKAWDKFIRVSGVPQ